MYILYFKETYIVKEPLRKNNTHQTWRGKQIAMCEEEQPLQDYINKQKRKELYYIEKQPERSKQKTKSGSEHRRPHND